MNHKQRATSHIWRDEQAVAKLCELWTGGKLSAREIALELGDGFTRDAVISKANRLGLGSHAHLARDPNIQRRAHGLPPKPVRRPPPAVEPAPIGIVREFTGCRWIHGNGLIDLDGPSCGHPQAEGSAYCAYHTRKAAGKDAAAERMAA